ncbi:MAG: prolyl-tRNA synthetase associated domain-containing protein [Oscillospiraceae bacterium]|nr:prolyl-tRNA synthetase associated domain-containing protein [Oscillospiraceae bacterium]
MYIDETVYTGRPADKRTDAQEAIYNKLDALSIPYIRVDHDHADTMEDCRLIEEKLGAAICKNLFLCNRQQTQFYLLMMRGEKPFKTKFLSAQLGCARLSFADADHMARYLNTVPGSVSALELLFDTEHHVQLVIDKPLMEDEFISAHPGLSCSTLRLTREDLLKFVQATGHEPVVVDLPVEEE